MGLGANGNHLYSANYADRDSLLGLLANFVLEPDC